GLRDVDAVITTRELARMIKQRDLDFANLEDSLFDDPMGEASGAGAIFGTTLPKEGITFVGFVKERFEVAASPAAFGMIEYNLKTNEYQLRDMNAQEREKYGDEYFAGLDNFSREGRIEKYAERDPKKDTDPVTGYGFRVVNISENEPVINGDMVTAPMVIDYKVEILRIIGTVYYK
ncbi:MAG: hypothetical protein II781_04930, partial [Clostridia bacterium]|nr:hypothetical protein [Clostridia bacterium]